MSHGTTRGVPLDPDATLAANSDLLVATQKATKSYVDTETAARVAADSALSVLINAAPILVPTTDARNVIQPSSATVTPLTLRGYSGQSDPLLSLENSASSVLASITSGGLFNAAAGAVGTPSLSFRDDPDTGFYSWGANTIGITTGGVLKAYWTSTGLQMVAGYTVKLHAGSAAGPGLNFNGATTTGLFTTGGVLGMAASGFEVGRFRAGGGGGLSIMSQGTSFGTVEMFRVATPVTVSNTANAILSASTTTAIPLVLQAAAAQSADLTQWQSSAGAVMASVNADGRITVVSTASNAYFAFPSGWLGYAGSPNTLISVRTAATNIGLAVRGFTAQSADLQQWQNSSSTVLAGVTAAGAGFFGSTGLYTFASSAALHVRITSSAVAASFVNTTAGSSGGAGMVGYQDTGSATLSGARLAYFLGGGAVSGAAISNAAGISMYATENWSAGVAGAELRFEVNPNGSATRTVRATIPQNLDGFTFGSAGDTNLYRSAADTLKTDDAFSAASYAVGATAGATGSFTTADAKTVTVTNGIITGIV